MTKQMFIHELKVALAQVDTNVRDEIVADISEHFTEGAAQGLSEADICRALGQPGSIAEQVLAELGSQTPPKRKPEHPVTGAFTQGADIDESFTGITHVSAKLETSSIHLLPSPNDQFRVTIRGTSKNETCNVQNENGKLVITVKNTKRWFGFGFNIGKSTAETTVYVPAQFMGELKVDTSVGHISATNTSGELDLDTSVGHVTVDGHTCKRVKIDTSTGNVSVRMANKYIEYVHIDTSVGNVEFEANEVGQLTIDTSVGSVNAKVTKISGDTKLDTSAGSVKFAAQEVEGNIKLDTSAGSITVFLPIDVNCRIDAKKPFGGSLRNHLRGNPQSPYVLRADSSAGAIHLNAL